MPETIFSAKVFRFFCSSVFRLSCCLLFLPLFLSSSPTAFALLQDDGTPCPPECVSDSLEIVTWYPSPYNEYEELRLYPISESNSPNGQCGQDNRGLMYYDQEDDKVYICKGAILGWKELGSGGSLTQSDTSISFCDSTNLGTIVYDTAQKRPYVCAQNTSNGYVWKPLDSDYDRDGITDAVDYNDNDLNDATAVEANVETGKTFYARGGSRRTGTLVKDDVNFCFTKYGGAVWCPRKFYSCVKGGVNVACNMVTISFQNCDRNGCWTCSDVFDDPCQCLNGYSQNVIETTGDGQGGGSLLYTCKK